MGGALIGSPTDQVPAVASATSRSIPKRPCLGLLRAGDPKGGWPGPGTPREAVRQIYVHADAELASVWIDELIADMSSEGKPTEVRSLARILSCWKYHIAAWHKVKLTNGPTEAAKNLIKRVKRTAFGFGNIRNYRTQSLLSAGNPNWSLFATITAHGDPKRPLRGWSDQGVRSKAAFAGLGEVSPKDVIEISRWQGNLPAAAPEWDQTDP
jgi:hypothetical protein